MMTAPIVIGAMGGSGTRVVARIVQRAGVFMGTNLNVSEDALEFVEFYDAWINRYVRQSQSRLTPADVTAMDAEFRRCVVRHRTTMAAEEMEWGWKEPRSIYLLPFFHARFPEMKFIHVLRDGRDMAFSSNQNQLRKHGAAVLGSDYDTLPAPVQSAGLWSRINMDAADYGERSMGERYLRVRFEDLCREPATVSRRICGFLGCEGQAADISIGDVSAPSSIGRWRASGDRALLSTIHGYARPALGRFGYEEKRVG